MLLKPLMISYDITIAQLRLVTKCPVLCVKYDISHCIYFQSHRYTPYFTYIVKITDKGIH